MGQGGRIVVVAARVGGMARPGREAQSGIDRSRWSREENRENINVDVGESGRAKRGGQSSKRER